MSMHTRTKVKKNATGATGAAPGTEQQPAGGTGAGNPPPADPLAALNELEARVDASLKALEEPEEREVTSAEFLEYASAQMEKALTEDKDKASKRLAALKVLQGIAKTAFEQNGAASIKIKLYVDPWQEQPQAKSVTPGQEQSARDEGDNIAFPNNVETAKRMIGLAKNLRDDASAVRKSLAKSAESGAAELSKVQKAGEAAALLEGVAAMFGVKATDCNGEYYGLGWKVSDIIYAVEQAARVEQAMGKLAGFVGGAAPAMPAEPPAEPVAAAADGVETTKTAKGWNSVPTGSDTDAWPKDMNDGSKA